MVVIQAAVGNARGFHAAADEARALLDAPGALDTRPPYTWVVRADQSGGFPAPPPVDTAPRASNTLNTCEHFSTEKYAGTGSRASIIRCASAA
jgi:hypothetical protein